MKYSWLLFDADGTLFDYPVAEANALQWTFEQLGIPFRSEFLEIYQKYNLQVWREFENKQVSAMELRTKRFDLLFAEINVGCDSQTFSPLYLQNLARGSILIEEAGEILQALARNYHLVLVTNGLSDVQRPRLERSGIINLFEKVFISEELGAAKPEKAFFDIVFREIGDPDKKKVLIIGDSLTSDMQGGLEYGIDTCWYNPAREKTTLPVTCQITSLRELLTILASEKI